MRRVTLAIAAAAVAACSDGPSRATSPLTHPSQANATLVSTDGSPAPSDGDRILLDTRTSLQKATSLATAEALFRGNDHTPARTAAGGLGWAFVRNFDGAGTSALRADWPTAKKCDDETNRIVDYLPDPLPKTLYVQWKVRFGRTPNDAAANGAVNAYTIENQACPAATAFAMSIFRDNDDDGPAGGVTLAYQGFSLATAALEQDALDGNLAGGNRGWTFAPSTVAGMTVKLTMFVQAASGPKTRDGVLRVWINGKLYFEQLNLALGQQGLSRFEFPGWRFGTVAESEYIWDVLAWASDPGPPTKIVVAPAATSIEVGAQAQLGATTYDANERIAAAGAIKWTSSDGKVASVDGNGMVTGRGPGTATITATSGRLSGSATVTVDPPPPAKINVKPAAASIKIGDKTQLSAAVYDAQSKMIAADVRWTSANTAIAIVDADGTVHGLAAGGPIKITATSGSVSDDAMVTVSPTPAAKVALAVVVSNANLTIGQTTQATVGFQLPSAVAPAVRAQGGAAPDVPVKPTWTSSNTTVATVSSTGVVTAVSPGTTNIIAKVDDFSGQATVTVTVPSTNPAPGPTAAILLDLRNSLQQATTIDQAFSLFGIVDHTPYRDAKGPNPGGLGWSFTTNADGHGLHALRADWAQSPYYNGYTSTGPTPLPCPASDSGCHDEGLRVIHYFPQPKPTEVYAQWKGRLGKFSTDADGNGANNSYAMWPQTDACKRALFDRPDDANRVDYTLGRFLPEQAKVEMGDHNYARLDNLNLWNPNSAAATGATFTTTVHVRAATADGVSDGIFQLWIDGKLILDYHDLPAMSEPFDRWSFPETCVTVSQPQSEYFWDILVWRP